MYEETIHVQMEEDRSSNDDHDDDDDDDSGSEKYYNANEEEDEVNAIAYSSDDDDDDDLEAYSVMRKYLKAICSRLKDESRTCNFVDKNEEERGKNKWLLKYLSENQFWIRAEYAEAMRTRLDIDSNFPWYYKDVKVWLQMRSSK